MSKKKLLLILSFILILLICSSLVYRDQQNSEASRAANSDYNMDIKNSITKIQPTSTGQSNKNIVKIQDSNLDYIYINYTVKSGDDLYSLARNFMPNYIPSGVIKEIKEKNNLKNETILVNKILLIPAEKILINNK